MDQISPYFVFLSEPQCFQCDIKSVTQDIFPLYSYHLNSEDLYDLALPLEKSRAKGGTMLMWLTSLDQYVTILPTSSPAILPAMVKMPGLITSYHIGIYLPTAGKEEDFIISLAALNIIIEDILEKTDGKCPIFIRGDGNSSSKNTSRSVLLNHLITQHSLQKLPIKHNTYHHFIGNGLFDSDLDIVLFSNLPGCSESLSDIICKNSNPLIDSHHDIVVSSFSLPPSPPTH